MMRNYMMYMTLDKHKGEIELFPTKLLEKRSTMMQMMIVNFFPLNFGPNVIIAYDVLF